MLKPWDDATSFTELTAPLQIAGGRVLLVADRLVVLEAVVFRWADEVTKEQQLTYSRANKRFTLQNGSIVRLVTVRSVCDHVLRGLCFDAAFVIDTYRWTTQDRLTVQQELLYVMRG